MRYIKMDKALPGMVLSKSINDVMDRTLLAEGKVLNEDIIQKLIERGYPGVYIEDSLSEDIEIQEIISSRLRNRTVQALQDMDLETAIKAAKEMVEEITETRTLALDLVDLRSFDDYTYRHSVNVAALSLVIAMGLNYSYSDMVDLSIAALFHDIGKIMIDKEILDKPGRLTAQENEIIKSHPKLSYDIISEKWSISSRIKSAVYCHHENQDGSGYPFGLTGDKIHPFAKIIHVVDVYDALTSKRPYKGAYSGSESMEYLMAGCGSLFDPEIVDVFIKYVPIYPKGIMVELSDGREAIVVENYPGNQLRPKLRLMDGSILDLQNSSENLNITILRQADSSVIVAEDIEKSEQGRNQRIKHILVVDGNITTLRDIRQVLKGEYEVSLAKSGKQAIAYAKNKVPDLIIMDVQMPDRTGIETIQAIRQEMPEDIPVIFMSAFADVRTVINCKNERAADFILKPFKSSYLKERIKFVLGEENI